MHVFLTGATGYVGSRVGKQLQAAGHTVVGLARTEASANKLRQLGIEPLLGDLQDTKLLAQAARSADGVIHTAFIHDYSDFEGAIKVEETVIATFVEALAESGKPLLPPLEQDCWEIQAIALSMTVKSWHSKMC